MVLAVRSAAWFAQRGTHTRLKQLEGLGLVGGVRCGPSANEQSVGAWVRGRHGELGGIKYFNCYRARSSF